MKTFSPHRDLPLRVLILSAIKNKPKTAGEIMASLERVGYRSCARKTFRVLEHLEGAELIFQPREGHVRRYSITVAGSMFIGKLINTIQTLSG